MKLCGNELPWVKEGMHLGHKITNKYDGMKSDMLMKRGMYIQKNCELMQEFSHCDPITKFRMNQIYNTHMTGSPLWSLFCRQSEMLEKSWNVSVRHMFNIPMKTHRYLIEAISQSPHLKVILMNRFLSFVNKIKQGKKKKLRHILEAIRYDCRSTTGDNLRQIMLITNKTKIEHLCKQDAFSVEYHPVDNENIWKIGVIHELMNTREGNTSIEGFDAKEIGEMLEFLCVS